MVFSVVAPGVVMSVVGVCCCLLLLPGVGMYVVVVGD